LYLPCAGAGARAARADTNPSIACGALSSACVRHAAQAQPHVMPAAPLTCCTWTGSTPLCPQRRCSHQRQA
jgi:hypothetical protein